MYCTCGVNNNYCPIHGEWEYEFEDRFYIGGEYGELAAFDFDIFTKVCRKYLSIKGDSSIKLKIKCKDGCIQIERIK